MQSNTIGKLAEALAKAQGEMNNAKKDAANPFFKSNYATLGAVIAAAKEPLSKNGLSVIQTMCTGAAGLEVVTTIAHLSGEWIKSRLPVNATKHDPQGIGSAITYARRYAYSAIVGITQEDDDGNAASQPRQQPKPQPKQQPKPKPEPDKQATLAADIIRMIGEADDMDALQDMFRDAMGRQLTTAQKKAVIKAKDAKKAQLIDKSRGVIHEGSGDSAAD